MENLQQKNFEQLAGAVRYYRWFADIAAPWTGSRILEIGCGQGNVTANFLDNSYVRGVDTEPAFIEHIRKRFQGHANFQADLGDITSSQTVERLKPERFDTAIAFNVLEHIEDDVAAAQHIYEILEPQGHCIALVPAFHWLMSPYDRAVGHWRRYTKRTLTATLASAGFTVVHARYFNALGALAWLWTYKILKKDEPGEGAIALLECLVPFLKAIERLVPVPFGLSVIAIGKKPAR